MAEFSSSIEIDAPPEVVFDHLVTPAGMVTWMGQRAELNPVPRGGFAVDVNGFPFRGEYLEVDPPHRVVVSWGIVGNAELPPDSSQVEFTMTPITSGTVLRLVHSGLPDTRVPGHAAGWRHYLAQLQLTATGSDPGIDTFVPPTAAVPTLVT